MKNLCLTVLTSLLVLPLYSAQTVAADLSAEKEQELKQILSNFLTGLGTASSGSMGFISNGTISITPKEHFFQATLPHLSHKSLDGSSVDIGTVSINAVPMEEDRQWKVSFSLPENINFYDKDNAVQTKIKFNEQKLSAIYDGRFGIFPKINATYDNIEITTGVDTGAVINIPRLKVIHNLEETEEGIFSGPIIYSVESAQKDDSKKKDTIDMDRISLTTMLTNYDIRSKEKTGALLGQIIDSNDSIDTNVFTSLMREVYLESSDALSFRVDVENLSLDPHAVTYNQGNSTIKIPNLSLQVGLNDLKQKRSSVDLDIAYKMDIDKDAEPSFISETIPYNTGISLSLNNIPKEDLLQTLKTQSPSPANAAGLVMTIIPLLTSSSTALNIRDVNIEAKHYSAALSGTVNANANALFQTTASLNATLKGLDHISTMLPTNLPPEEPYAQKLAEIMGVLSMLKMTGKQQGDEDIRTYNLKVTEAGQIIMNGNDLSILTGMGQFTPVPPKVEPELPY